MDGVVPNNREREFKVNFNPKIKQTNEETTRGQNEKKKKKTPRVRQSEEKTFV